MFFAQFWLSRAILHPIMVVKRVAERTWDVLRGNFSVLKSISLEQWRDTTTDAGCGLTRTLENRNNNPWSNSSDVFFFALPLTGCCVRGSGSRAGVACWSASFQPDRPRRLHSDESLRISWFFAPNGSAPHPDCTELRTRLFYSSLFDRLTLRTPHLDHRLHHSSACSRLAS